jgi:mannose-6-phosphate isomerase-like protein (cupin superfamily)
MKPIDAATAPHYLWGKQCEGWRLVDQPGLSVIEESMPAHTAENRHSHREARQFFYMLEGLAEMETSLGIAHLGAGAGIEVPPGILHRILNRTDRSIRFLVISAPSTRGDRMDG